MFLGLSVCARPVKHPCSGSRSSATCWSMALSARGFNMTASSHVLTLRRTHGSIRCSNHPVFRKIHNFLDRYSTYVVTSRMKLAVQPFHAALAQKDRAASSPRFPLLPCICLLRPTRHHLPNSPVVPSSALIALTVLLFGLLFGSLLNHLESEACGRT